jgi:hypothetical protein
LTYDHRLSTEQLEAGDYSYTVSVKALAAGLYFVRVQTLGDVRLEKLVVAH